jgi:hypothetical protein
VRFVFTTVIEPDCEPESPVLTVVLPAEDPWPWPLLLPLLLPMTVLVPDVADAAVAVVTVALLSLETAADEPWWPFEPETEEPFELTTVSEAALEMVSPVFTVVLPPFWPLLLPITVFEPDEADAEVEVTTVALFVLSTVAAKAGAAANIARVAAVAMIFFIDLF